MSSCQFCQEDLCIAEIELGKDFKCNYMVYEEGSSIPLCSATEKDLLAACSLCELLPAKGNPPYEDYCEGCAEAQRIEDEEQDRKALKNV